MIIEQLIEDAKSSKYLDNMKNAKDILSKYILSQDVKISQAQNRYCTIFCCYVFRYAMYIQELCRSLDTIDFLSINCIGRSAIECYSFAKFLYLNYSKDTNKLFQLIVASDLKELNTIINNYEKEIDNIPELSKQRDNNKQIFVNELHIFEEAESWLSKFDNYKDILKKVKENIKLNNFASSICSSEGYISINKLVCEMIKSNKYYKYIYGHNVEANVFYSLMCSSAHNDYFDVLKLFIVPDTETFKISLYPQPEENNNKNVILKLLYANFIDLVNCLIEITTCITLTNENGPNMIFYPSDKMSV